MLALGASEHPAAHEFRRAGAARLVAAREPGGVWRFWPAGHPRHDSIPPDLEDTACAALALAGAGVDPEVDPRLFATLRGGDGRFRTWIVSDGSPFADADHPFWRDTEARPDDVDAGANAQAVALLAARGVDDSWRGAAAWLLGVARGGGEEAADKWYRSAPFVRYLMSRAADAASALAPARAAIAAAIQAVPATAGGSAPELAVTLTTAISCGVDAPVVAALAARLLALQEEDGGYPRAPVWYGGPKRSVDWGSRELSTIFALEAIAACDALNGARRAPGHAPPR
jgi:hypothetical protein